MRISLWLILRQADKNDTVDVRTKRRSGSLNVVLQTARLTRLYVSAWSQKFLWNRLKPLLRSFGSISRVKWGAAADARYGMWGGKQDPMWDWHSRGWGNVTVSQGIDKEQSLVHQLQPPGCYHLTCQIRTNRRPWVMINGCGILDC